MNDMGSLGFADLTLATEALANRKRAEPTSDLAKARAAAEDFEAFFVSQSLDIMTKGIESDGMFGGGNGERVFRTLLNQEYGKAIAKAGGFGIADMVMQEMIKQQETVQ